MPITHISRRTRTCLMSRKSVTLIYDGWEMRGDGWGVSGEGWGVRRFPWKHGWSCVIDLTAILTKRLSKGWWWMMGENDVIRTMVTQSAIMSRQHHGKDHTKDCIHWSKIARSARWLICIHHTIHYTIHHTIHHTIHYTIHYTILYYTLYYQSVAIYSTASAAPLFPATAVLPVRYTRYILLYNTCLFNAACGMFSVP